jgi:hypothetical protein
VNQRHLERITRHLDPRCPVLQPSSVGLNLRVDRKSKVIGWFTHQPQSCDSAHSDFSWLQIIGTVFETGSHTYASVFRAGRFDG